MFLHHCLYDNIRAPRMRWIYGFAKHDIFLIMLGHRGNSFSFGEIAKEYFMKYLSFLFLVFAVISANAQVPTVFSTGPQPLAIHRAGNFAHIFCNGDDKDYDGVYESVSGEKPAYWVTHDISNGNVIDSKVMNKGYFNVPFRPGFSSSKMFHPRGNRIEVYDLSSKELIDSALVSLPNPKSIITAVYVITSSLNGVEQEIAIALSHKTSFTEKGTFSIYDLSEKRIVAQTEVGINPQMIRSFRNLLGETEYVVLCEGTFGAKNSTLHRLLPTPMMGEPFEKTVFELGDTGNYVDIVDQLALTLMNGSHEVMAIDLATNRVLPGSFPVGTEGYDGPRELLIDPSTNQVFISTYASDIRIGSLSDGTMLDSWSTSGKAEGMALIDGNVWVCSSFKKGEYVYDSVINVFPFDFTSSINEKDPIHSNVSIHNGILTIYQEDGHIGGEFIVIDATGNTILKNRLEGHETKIIFSGLPHGLYGISINSVAKTKKFLIIHSE